jgi:hypothetical protein
MSEIKIPTVGRQVHYFPITDQHCSANNATVLPATVVQVFGSTLNLSVMCMNPDGPVVIRFSVFHKSDVINEKYSLRQSYWDWPEIK